VAVTGAIVQTLAEAAVNAVVFGLTLALELFVAHAVSTALIGAQALVACGAGVLRVANALL
jgi:hypothetical protein